MRVRTRYGKIEVIGDGGEAVAGWRPSEVLDDFLGLERDEQDVPRYVAYLERRYRPLVVGALADAEWWHQIGVITWRAVYGGTEGRLLAAEWSPLAAALEAIRWRGGGEADIAGDSQYPTVSALGDRYSDRVL